MNQWLWAHRGEFYSNNWNDVHTDRRLVWRSGVQWLAVATIGRKNVGRWRGTGRVGGNPPDRHERARKGLGPPSSAGTGHGGSAVEHGFTPTTVGTPRSHPTGVSPQWNASQPSQLLCTHTCCCSDSRPHTVIDYHGRTMDLLDEIPPECAPDSSSGEIGDR